MQPVDTYLDFSSAAKQFWAAPDEALFPQAALVAVTGLSNAHFERCRWQVPARGSSSLVAWSAIESRMSLLG
jgi:hypothetical protein